MVIPIITPALANAFRTLELFTRAMTVQSPVAVWWMKRNASAVLPISAPAPTPV